MVSHHFFLAARPLALSLAFCPLVPFPVPSARCRPATSSPEPLIPKRPRSNEPKPFEGLIHKAPLRPVCTRHRVSQSAFSGAARSHGTDPPASP